MSSRELEELKDPTPRCDTAAESSEESGTCEILGAQRASTSADAADSDRATPNADPSASDHDVGRRQAPQSAPGSTNPLTPHPHLRSAIETATGLSGDDLEEAVSRLSETGLSVSLRPDADREARYAHAISLVSQGWSLRAAARETDLDASNLRRKMLRNRELVPAGEERHKAAEERILTLAEELSEAAAEKLLADVEADRLRPADLVKTYSAATNQVATKRRWGKDTTAGSGTRTKETLDALVRHVLEKGRNAEDREQAIDVVATESKGNENDG